MEKQTCFITKKQYSNAELREASLLREPLFNLIKNDFPDFSRSDIVSVNALNDYRKKYLSQMIADENGEIDHLEREVIQSITQDKLVSENIDEENKNELTIGQRVADNIALFGGSWTFILFFFSFILLWMIVNIIFFTNNEFDPYPFILLNLILSCLAAIQAPIIMMSQNRQNEKDRSRSEQDYKINLKAELEIKLLHEKMDHLLLQQNKRLLEIQEIQTDYLEDILKAVNK